MQLRALVIEMLRLVFAYYAPLAWVWVKYSAEL